MVIIVTEVILHSSAKTTISYGNSAKTNGITLKVLYRLKMAAQVIVSRLFILKLIQIISIKK